MPKVRERSEISPPNQRDAPPGRLEHDASGEVVKPLGLKPVDRPRGEIDRTAEASRILWPVFRGPWGADHRTVMRRLGPVGPAVPHGVGLLLRIPAAPTPYHGKVIIPIAIADSHDSHNDLAELGAYRLE